MEATSSASTGDGGDSPTLTITYMIDGTPVTLPMGYNAKKDKYSIKVLNLDPKPGTVKVASSAGGSAESLVGGR